MFPIPPNEILVETKVCKHCGISFPITDKDVEFYEKVSPVFSGKKYIIPPPTLCPDCRQQRRLSFRNERKLYKRTCDFSGKDIISIYSPDKPFKVYHQDYWWSDKWNPLQYGKEFDFSQSFVRQFTGLFLNVPHASTEVNMIENSEYSNCVGKLKNCYLLFASGTDEDCLYGDNLERSQNCIDTTFIYDCYECYDLCTSYNCYKVYHGFNCRDCNNAQYLTNCTNCKNCFACVGIHNKEFYILNKKYTKDDYISYIRNISPQYLKELLQEYKKLKYDVPIKFYNGYNLENSTGDYQYNCSNLTYSYINENSKESKYLTFCRNTEYCIDFDFFGDPGDFCYESLTCGYSSSLCLFSISCINSVSLLFYCYSCYSCQNCFACIGLRNASYCILNRQYSREEYETLVPKIIEHMIATGEWGEFFPSSLSPFGYNETVAQEYFPISSPQPSPKGEGASETENKETFRKVWIPSSPSLSGEGVRGGGGNGGFGGNWSLYESPFPKVDKIIPASKLPDDITKIPDDILNWAIECEVTGKPFRIIPQELEFYRKHHLPIPRRHPDQRHLDRMKMRNPRKLYERVCDCPECEINNKTSLSSFSPNENPFGTRERDSPTENDKETVDTFVINPRTGKKGKKMITTYAPERPERVYCEVCYEREVVG